MLLTLGHAQICPDNKDKLALFIAGIDFRIRLRSAQSLSAVCRGAIGPVGRMVEDAVAFVDVALVTLLWVVEVAAALFVHGWGDDVTACRKDASHVTRHDAGQGRGEDDACCDAAVVRHVGAECF